VRDANVEGTTETRLQVDGVTTEVVPEAAYDFDNESVTLTVKQGELEKALEGKLADQPFSAMNARALQNYSAFGVTWDLAAAPDDAVYVFGTACKGGAAPKPAASPSASAGASPEPSASPSASPSAEPSPSASPSPSAPPPPPEPAVPVPADGCIGFPDEQGDSDAAVGPAGSGDDSDLDLLSVTGRTTSTVLAGHLGVAELSSGPSLPMFTGHRFQYEFAVGGKVVVLSADETGPGTGRIDGEVNESLVVEAVFDEPSSQVVLSVTRASLMQALGLALPDGTTLMGVAARSYALTPATATVADTASPEDARQAEYVLGDSTCFQPKLTVSAPAEVQTSDPAIVTIGLTTSDDRVAEGQRVTARVGGGTWVSALTDAQGMTTLSLPVTDPAGTRALVVRTSGDAGEGELRSAVRVLVERSVLSLRSSGSGSTRTLTATLTDDDGRALTAQRVVFTFSDRSVATTTDSRGRAAVSVPPGTVVDVAFAGRAGRLSPAKARGTA
jgi:hypothetical protein